MRPFHVRGTERAVLVVKLNYDGDLFFQGSQDGNVNCWLTETGERLGNFKTSAAIKTLDVTDDTQFLVTGSLEGSVDIFKVQGGINLGTLKNPMRKAKHVEFSFGDKYLLLVYQPMSSTGTYDIRVLDFEYLRDQLSKATAPIDINTLTFLREWSFSDTRLTQASWGFLNKTIIISTQDGELGLLDWESGKFIKREKFHEGDIKQFALAKDYSIMATAAQDGCKVFCPDALEEIRYFKYEVPMNAVAISPLLQDDQEPKPHLIVAGGIPARETARTKFQGFDIHICNITFEEEVGKFLNPNQIGPINSLDFFPDGRGFVTGEEGGYSRVYKFDSSYWENDIFK